MSGAASALNVGWSEDGWPHMRDEQTGTCRNCGARAGEGHYKLRSRVIGPEDWPTETELRDDLTRTKTGKP